MLPARVRRGPEERSGGGGERGGGGTTRVRRVTKVEVQLKSPVFNSHGITGVYVIKCTRVRVYLYIIYLMG